MPLSISQLMPHSCVFRRVSRWVALFALMMVWLGLASAQTESVLVNFTGTTGAAPGVKPFYVDLIQASDGNFYGTTENGGANGYGTVFSVNSAGTVYTVLHSFSTATTEGRNPYAGLVQGTDGNFYGTTEAGGANGFGTVFQITPTGTLTLLHSFSNATTDGENPYGGLIQGVDGNFYGTTYAGGANSNGTVFKISSAGAFALLHSFSTATSDGAGPYSGLVQGTDGNLYGTTLTGGAFGTGGIAYKISPSGGFTQLHSFQNSTTNGYFPSAGLVQGTDGNFYGTTQNGGTSNDGTVYKITSTGSFTLLHSFSTATTDGIYAYAGLVEGTDGNFYGTTGSGGAHDEGTIYKISSTGNFSLIYSFTGQTSDGFYPYGGLVQGMDGSFYGTTSFGGTSNDGTVIKLIASPVLTAPVTLSVPSSVVAGGSFALSYTVANAYSETLQQCFATNTAGDTTGWTGVLTGSPNATNVELTAPLAVGTYTYSLTCGGMQSALATVRVLAAPTTSVSSVTTTAGSTSGIPVTASESGSAGAVTGGVVTFSVISPATGSFSPTSCTLSSAGTCTVSYLPTGSLAGGTYTNDIQASFAANTSYAAAVADGTLTVTAVAPSTVSLSAVTAGYQVTSGFPITATESGSAGTANGSVVTFGVASPATGSFNPATCTITNGSCTTTYYPTGTLAFGAYSNDLTATFAAGGPYTAASASSTLTIDGESVLLNFTGNTGAAPGADSFGSVIQANDGGFYGVTEGGGANGYGTVFKLSSTGAYTLLHSFANSTSDGGEPTGGLVQGTDGNFYGTTVVGGSNGFGTIFKITSTGVVTILRSLSYLSDGGEPYGGLVRGTDGNFYGMSYTGGANGYGTVFKISPVSPYTFTLMHSFSNATNDGVYPYAGLVQGTDGNFYGTTGGGGLHGLGTIFKISPTSPYTLTLLHSFTNAGTDGDGPYAGLVQGPDGNFYGTTYGGGSGGVGTLFKISPTSPYTFTQLHSFVPGVPANGSAPYYGNLVLGTDGNFYGTTISGGQTGYGTVFSTTSSGTFTLLHSFSNGTTDGNSPYGGLVQGADGNFYGMTNQGGSSSDGVIFKLVASPALTGPVALTVPASVTVGSGFTLSYSVANAYSATLQQCFATNTAGDTTGWTGIKTGSATSANASLTAPSTPATYTYTLTCGGMESSQVALNVVAATPTVSVTGVSVTGGSTSGVTVTATESGSAGVVTGGVVTFSVISPATGSFSPATCALTSAGTCSTTYYPSGSLAVGTYTNDIQASFAANNEYLSALANSTLTVSPGAPTVAVSSVTAGYGVTTGYTVTATETGSAGTASGSVVTFGVTGSATGSFNPTTCTISAGSCTTTYFPTGTLAFGTYTNDITASFTASSNYTAGSSTSTLTIDGESVLVNFTGNSGAAPGTNPRSGYLIQASDGNFYGTTQSGGANGKGEVFQVSPAGTVTVLHSFSTATTDGASPWAGLVEGTDGSFYGTTFAGGASGAGTVFKITSSGSFTLLHSFTGMTSDGSEPEAGLVQGTDGNFYGTAYGGGSNYDGIVFKISAAGTFALVHSFTGGTADGQSPIGGLVQGADGNFYGTTLSGGANGQGTVFKMTSAGTVTLLHSFAGGTSDGLEPYAGLVQGTDGNFYGTSAYAGSPGQGTLFKVSSTGTFTLLHVFAGGATDGQLPLAGLVEGSDGNFYGSTEAGGANGAGTLFKVSSTGTFTQLHSFANTVADGDNSYAGLVQGADGKFYGATFSGGADGDGVLFKLATATALAAPVALAVPASVGAGTSFSLNYSVANAYSSTLQQCFATNTAGDTTGWVGLKTGSPTANNASLTAPSTAGTYTYTLTCGGMESSQATLNVFTPVAPTTATVSAVSAPFGSGTGVTVTATESGSSGAVTGGVVTFSVISPATGSFSPTTCTLNAGGTCTTTYTPTGSLAAGTYTNGIKASFAANNAYAAATGYSTLTIVGVTPTVTVSGVQAGFGSTSAIQIGVSETGTSGTANGGVVTFSVTSPATGSFSPATCTISNGYCSTTYVPTGTLPIGTYTNDIVASLPASGHYAAASATSTLIVDGESVLLNFTNQTGAAPDADPLTLIQASDGNFYGVAAYGGTNNSGAVFKLTPGGTYTVLHSFAAAGSSDGYAANGLVQGTDGNFYGTTYEGGTPNNNGYGTVFKITSAGAMTILHTFTNSSTDGQYPLAGVIQGIDGNFYGTTEDGGAAGAGVIYKITPTGTFTLLHSFVQNTDGSQPSGTLVQGSDGNFYGVASAGGSKGAGTIYKVSPAGTFTLLYTFTGSSSDGKYPEGGLVQAADGNFYGTTTQGGPNVNGSIFRITPGGVFTQIYGMGINDGSNPLSALTLGSDGNLYGVADVGNADNGGTFYEVTTGGTYTLLHSFAVALNSAGNSTDGRFPEASPIQGADGNFYGTTYEGGATGYGTIYKLIASPALAAPIALSVPSSVAAGSPFTLTYSVANAYSQTMQQCFATNSGLDFTGWVGVKTGSPTAANAILIAPAFTGSYTYTLTCGGVESSSVTLNVTAASTVTSVTAQSNPVTTETPVNFYATVSGAPTVTSGTVTFTENGSTIAGCSAQSVVNGEAVCTTLFPYPGTYSIVATYNGSTTYSGSASSPYSETVNANTPTITFNVPTHHTIDAPFTVSASSNSSGAITYSYVSGPATLSGSTVTLTGVAGTVELMASQSAAGSYAAGSNTASFNVVAGSVWLGNTGGSVSIFGSDGAALLNETGGGLGTPATPLGEAFDSAGKLWIASTNGVSAFTETGTAVQSTAFTGGGLSSPVSLAVDGAGLIWVANSNSTVSVLNNSGTAISPSGGYPATASGTPGGVAIDLSGSVWVTNQSTGTVTQIIGAATPAAPASTALKNGTTGTQP